MISPLFPHEYARDASVLRIANGPAGIHSVMESPGDNFRIVENVEEAEDHIIALASKTPNCFSGHAALGCPPLALIFPIYRAANAIAAKSRRGAGNTILIHPSKVCRLDGVEVRGLVSVPRLHKEQVGRWRKEGQLTGRMAVYSSPEMPENFAVVAYIGTTDFFGSKIVDAPGFLSRTDAGQLCFYELQPNSACLGQAGDYVAGITL